MGTNFFCLPAFASYKLRHSNFEYISIGMHNNNNCIIDWARNAVRNISNVAMECVGREGGVRERVSE